MNQHGGSLTDTLVKLVLIFFISLLSFSVGTFVGKQFADGQRKYTSLEADYNSQRETASVAEGEHVKSDEALTDEDIANLTEEFVKSEKEKGKDIMKHEGSEHGSEAAAHGDEHGRSVKVVGKGSKNSPAKGHEDSSHGASADHGSAQAAGHGSAPAAGHGSAEAGHGAVAVAGKADAHGKADSHGAAKGSEHGSAPAAKGSEHGSGHQTASKAEGHAPAGVQQAAERVAHGELPTKAVVAEKRAPSSLPPVVSASTAGKYTVQIAAYATENEAQKRVTGLKEKGFSAFTVTAQKNGKNFYRVSVGLYSSQKDAVSARENLAKQADLKDAFVQKIVE